MKRFFIPLMVLSAMLWSTYAQATASIISKSGEVITSKTIAQLNNDPLVANTKVVIRSPQTVANTITWRNDADLVFEKGSSITYTGGGSLSGERVSFGVGVPIMWTFNAGTNPCTVTFSDGAITSTCGWQTSQASTGQKLTLLEGTAGGANFRKISVPDVLSTDLELRLPNTVPSGTQALVFATPTNGISAGSFYTLGSIASLTAGTLVNGKYCTYNATGSLISCNADGGSSGTMTWPASTGITNYAGASAWGTSYTTMGTGSVVALSADPVFTGTINAPSLTSTSADGAHYLNVSNTSAPTYASPARGHIAYNLATDKLIIHNGTNWTTWNLLKNTDVGTLSALTAGTMTNSKYCTYNSSGTQIVCDSDGGTGSMTWPASGGIANYSGSSSWGTSYTTTGSGTVVALAAAPTITGHPTIESVTSTGATGSGKFVFDTSPTLSGPIIGTATGTSLAVTGVLDGVANVIISTTTPVSAESPEKLFVYYIADYANTTQAIVYTLPTAAAGKQRCYRNNTTRTGTIRINTSASGQYIDNAGVSTASGGYIISGGALGDGVCLVGVTATSWIAYPTLGTWTTN